MKNMIMSSINRIQSYVYRCLNKYLTTIVINQIKLCNFNHFFHEKVTETLTTKLFL